MPFSFSVLGNGPRALFPGPRYWASFAWKGPPAACEIVWAGPRGAPGHSANGLNGLAASPWQTSLELALARSSACAILWARTKWNPLVGQRLTVNRDRRSQLLGLVSAVLPLVSALAVLGILLMMFSLTDYLPWQAVGLCLVGTISPPIALVLGLMARRRAAEGNARRLSWVGIGLGGLATVLLASLWLLLFLARPPEPLGLLGFHTPSVGRSPTIVGEARSYWEISGRIDDNGLTLNPLFSRALYQEPEADPGDYRLEVLDSNGEILRSNRFDLETLPPPAGGTTGEFRVFVHKTPGVSALRILAPGAEMLGSVRFTGLPPSVLILSPQVGETVEGRTTISWQGTDPDSDSLYYRVLYSTDDGATVERITAPLQEQEFLLNLNRLPACTEGCLLEVQVSDGVNSALDQLGGFQVRKSNPETWISRPEEGAAFRSNQFVILRGASVTLEGEPVPSRSLIWTSDRDGKLGQGDRLELLEQLSPGKHRIRLTAVDSQGRHSWDEVSIVVDDARPAIELSLGRDASPSRCVDVTIQAEDEPGGSGLAEVAYSLDGGESWVDVPVADLPYHFVVPRTGEIQLEAYAEDRAGNADREVIRFLTAESCPNMR